jgi:hypothetical protein
MIGIVNISTTVTGWTHHCIISPRVEALRVHFSPPSRPDRQRHNILLMQVKGHLRTIYDFVVISVS